MLAEPGHWCPAAEVPPARPRLAGLIGVDQMRGDSLARWHALFGEGGSERLQKEGTGSHNCHYPYAHTVTAAGHASIGTGCSPLKHGIVANEWYDRATGKPVVSVSSDRYSPVPAPKLDKSAR